MRRGKWGKIVLALGVGILLTDIALTLWVIPDGVYVWRALPPLRACFTSGQRAWLDDQQRQLREGVERGGARFDSELGWRPVAGHRGNPSDPDTPSYGELGARGAREYAPLPPDGVLRLTCWGDSFTHGDEVADADTWERQLEDTLPRCEVLNFGVGGYGTDQAVLRFRREGLLGARAVLIGYLVENAGRNVNRYRPWYCPSSPNCGAKPRFLEHEGQLELVPLPYLDRAGLIDAIVSERVLDELAEHEYWHDVTRWPWTRYSSLLRFARGWWADCEREPQRFYAARDGEPYRVTLALLESFHREALAHGAERAPVLVFPGDRELVRLAAGEARYWQPLLDDLAARGVEAIDLSDAFLAEWNRPSEAAPRRRMFVENHYSRAGNAVVARTLQTWVESTFPSGR